MMRCVSKLLGVGVLVCGTILMAGCVTPPVNAVAMKTDVRRYGCMAEVKPDQVEACRALFAKVPAEVTAALTANGLRNVTVYLKSVGDRTMAFHYAEYTGRDFAATMAKLRGQPVFAQWHKAVSACLVSGTETAPAWQPLESVFCTEGAAKVVPTPSKYARIGMITGLKPEQEAEYRTLHATTWPGVLQGIADCNLRNFSIFLTDFGGKLYLIGYLEYVGADGAADDAKGKALAINKRWWKFTDACQDPLPEAAAKKTIWAGMDEVFHLD